MKNTDQRSKGLSFIELIVVMVILAFLVKVAVPAVQNIVTNIMTGAVSASLGELRAAILAYSSAEITAGRASRFASGAAGGWPTADQINEAKYAGGTNIVLQSRDVPENPFAKRVFSQDFDRVIASAGARGTLSGTAAGWDYNQTTGEVWPNTNVNGENLY